jgi:hypothetical protein
MKEVEKMSNEEIEFELNALKQILEFHSTYGVIRNEKEYQAHINDILDRHMELKKEQQKREKN